jgi:hypothetical protein
MGTRSKGGWWRAKGPAEPVVPPFPRSRFARAPKVLALKTGRRFRNCARAS